MISSQLLGLRFRIGNPELDLLGRGGMGAVYRATDTHTGETVAITLLEFQTPQIASTSASVPVHRPPAFGAPGRHHEDP